MAFDDAAVRDRLVDDDRVPAGEQPRRVAATSTGSMPSAPAAVASTAAIAACSSACRSSCAARRAVTAATSRSLARLAS